MECGLFRGHPERRGRDGPALDYRHACKGKRQAEGVPGAEYQGGTAGGCNGNRGPSPQPGYQDQPGLRLEGWPSWTVGGYRAIRTGPEDGRHALESRCSTSGARTAYYGEAQELGDLRYIVAVPVQAYQGRDAFAPVAEDQGKLPCMPETVEHRPAPGPARPPARRPPVVHPPARHEKPEEDQAGETAILRDQVRQRSSPAASSVWLPPPSRPLREAPAHRVRRLQPPMHPAARVCRPEAEAPHRTPFPRWHHPG